MNRGFNPVVPEVYAVYGTLMEGGGLSTSVEGMGHYGDRVEILDADLYLTSPDGGIPFLKRGAGTVKAQLWHPDADRAEGAMYRLDQIEGAYDREEMPLADGRKAHVYVYHYDVDGYWKVPSGDYRKTPSWIEDLEYYAARRVLFD